MSNPTIADSTTIVFDPAGGGASTVRRNGLSIMAVVLLAGCALNGPHRMDCQIREHRATVPSSVGRVKLGMSLAELKHLFNNGDPYSPTDGEYYFITDDEACALEGMDRMVSCGVDASFRKADGRVGDSLQGCSWGAIGE